MTPISFEFYPPKTDEQRAQLDKTAAKLKSQNARVRVVHLRRRRLDAELHARNRANACTRPTASTPRRTCPASAAPARNSASCCERYKAMGCRRIVALRGDLPSGMGHTGDFRYATDLVEFIRREHDGYFHIEVGCYPEMPSAGRRRARRPAPLQGQDRRRRRRRDHPVLLQRRRVFPLRRRCAPARRRRADRAGHHADLELHPAPAFLRRLRRRDPALDRQAHAGLRRRRRGDPRVRRRPGRGDCAGAWSKAARRACTSTR